MEKNEMLLNDDYSAYIQKKLQFYKQTLQLVKSTDMLEQFINMKNEMDKLQEEFVQLKKEVDSLKKITYKEKDNVNRVVEGPVKKEESGTIEHFPDTKKTIKQNETISYKELSYLLKSSGLESDQQTTTEELVHLEQFPLGLHTSLNDRLTNFQSSNKHSIRIRADKKKVSPTQLQNIDFEKKDSKMVLRKNIDEKDK